MVDLNRDTDCELVFPRIKRKFIFGVIVAAALLCSAVAVWLVADRQHQYKPSHLKAAAIIGACLVVFYGAYNIWELCDQTPGCVIDREGMIDNMGASPLGRIPWKDVTGLRLVEAMGSDYVVVDVVDHQKYVDRLGWSRSLVKLATEMVGSPVTFSGEEIGLTARELLIVLSDARLKYDVTSHETSAPNAGPAS